MRRVTIIEGTDGVGKTTYAKWLAKRLGGEYRHASAPTKETVHEEYLEPILEHLASEGDRPLILDRWHIGEMVWPDLFGRPSLFGEGQEAVNAFCQVNRILGATEQVEVVVVYRDAGGIIQTLRDRGETEEEVKRSLQGQDKMLQIGLSAMLDSLPIELVNSDRLPTSPRYLKARV